MVMTPREVRGESDEAQTEKYIGVALVLFVQSNEKSDCDVALRYDDDADDDDRPAEEPLLKGARRQNGRRAAVPASRNKLWL